MTRPLISHVSDLKIRHSTFGHWPTSFAAHVHNARVDAPAVADDDDKHESGNAVGGRTGALAVPRRAAHGARVSAAVLRHQAEAALSGALLARRTKRFQLGGHELLF